MKKIGMRYILVTLFCAVLMTGQTQIIMGKENKDNSTSKDKEQIALQKNKEEKKVKKKGGIEIYGGVSPSYTFRTLSVREGLFAQPLSYRKEETGKWTTSYEVGVRSQLSPHFKLSFGAGFFHNRESYASKDSVFSYTNTYREVAFPIRVAYSYGNNISFYAGIGIAPTMFISMKKELTKLDINNHKKTTKSIHKENMNIFLVSALVDIGVQIKIAPSVGVFVMVEGRRQLIDNYTKSQPYKRKAYALGLTCGIEFYL